MIGRQESGQVRVQEAAGDVLQGRVCGGPRVGQSSVPRLSAPSAQRS